MIISGGENIFPLEVENVLRMNEEIAEVSVLGVLDEYWGESVQAAVVLRPDSKLTPGRDQNLLPRQDRRLQDTEKGICMG